MELPSISVDFLDGLTWLVVPTVAIVFGVALPAAILFGRFGLKRQRQAVLQNLRATLKHATGRDAALIPAFEFALQKYELEPREEPQRQRRELFFYVWTSLAFMVVATAGFLLLLSHAADSDPGNFRYVLGGIQDMPADDAARAALTSYEAMTKSLIAFAFLGGYIWAIQYLLRRIGSFDLSPMSFIRVTAQIILACATVIVLRHFIPASAGEAEWSKGMLLLIAFLIGFFPHAGLDFLMQKVPQLRLKRLDPDAAAAMRALPVELVDGIDSHVSFRLAEREIVDVAGLAAENPVLLCAESPYPLLAVVDWIAQAQLALEVGPKAFKRLREAGVRTIFALEAAARDPQLEASVLTILYEIEAGRPKSLRPRLAAMRANLHVARLFQVWEVVNATMQVRPADTAMPDRKGLLRKRNGATTGPAPAGQDFAETHLGPHALNRQSGVVGRPGAA